MDTDQATFPEAGSLNFAGTANGKEMAQHALQAPKGCLEGIEFPQDQSQKSGHMLNPGGRLSWLSLSPRPSGCGLACSETLGEAEKE